MRDPKSVPKRLKSVIFFIFLILLCSKNHLYPFQPDQELTLHFIDVGKGDSTLITLPDGENLLIDAGSPYGGIKVARYLKNLGIERIEHLIFTHPHDDHIGGIFSIEAEFKILNFYDNGFSNFESEIYPDYVRLVRKDLNRYHPLQAGEIFRFGRVYIKVLNPLLPPTGDLNADSIVLRIIYDRIKILLTGDLNILGERRLIKGGEELSSDILKVSHHGDRDATSEEFLRYVKPKVAVISISRMDRFARPHPSLLKRLNRIGARIYRTDLNGSIIIHTDGKRYLIETEK